jgi:hypothetical protein
VVSLHLAEAIRAQLPAFKPTPPASPTPVVAAVAAVGKEAVPVVLDWVVVTEKKGPGMDELQMRTKAGPADCLWKRFPGAVVPRRDPLDESTPHCAARMLRDRRRQENQRR